MATMTDRRAGLVQACDDPRLFAFDLWPKQRELLGAVEAGPRLHVWALGRRASKTTMAALTMLWDALLRPELAEHVRAGERRYSVAVATNLRQARLLVQAASSIVHRSPLLAELVEAETDDEIGFRNGTAVAAFPCTSRGGRGWPISCLVLDEAAHLVDTEGNSAAESVWRALVPSTAQWGDAARIIVSSTPYGQDGLFAQLYQQASSGELADATAFQATTAEANPTITPAFLATEQARDPESFRSEYEAQFVGGGASFLDPTHITDAVADRGEIAPDQLDDVIAGLDPAFSSDPFGLAIVGRLRLVRVEERHRLHLAFAQAWKPPKRKADSFEERRAVEDAVLAEVAAVCRRYGARRVVTDQYAAPAIVSALRRHGLSVKTIPMTASSKTSAFLELRARLTAGTLDLYDHSGLLIELRRLRTRYAAGSASVVNPRVGGSHGDLAQALALAIYEHDRRGVSHGRKQPPLYEAVGGSLGTALGRRQPLTRDMRL
jgi:hypothetical protein